MWRREAGSPGPGAAGGTPCEGQGAGEAWCQMDPCQPRLHLSSSMDPGASVSPPVNGQCLCLCRSPRLGELLGGCKRDTCVWDALSPRTKHVPHSLHALLCAASSQPERVPTLQLQRLRHKPGD